MKYDFTVAGVLVEDEAHSLSDGALISLDHDLIKGNGVEVWTGEGRTGTELVNGTDYSLSVKDEKRTARAGFDIFTKFSVLNLSYFNIPLYVTYTACGDYLSVRNIKNLINEYGPTDEEKAALVGTSGTPNAANPYVTDGDERLPTTAEKATFGFIPTEDEKASLGDIPSSDEKAALVGSYGVPSAANPYVTKDDPAIASLSFNVTAGSGYTVFEHNRSLQYSQGGVVSDTEAFVLNCMFSGSIRLELDLRKSGSYNTYIKIYKNNEYLPISGLSTSGTNWEAKNATISSLMPGDAIRVMIGTGQVAGSGQFRNVKFKSTEDAVYMKPYMGAAFRLGPNCTVI